MTRARLSWTRAEWVPACLLLVMAAIWFAVRSRHGIHFFSFGDESGHFVGARAIRVGDILYRDFIDAHGPVCFMAAQAFGILFGWKEPLNARWGIVVLAGLAALSIHRSPALRSPVSRLWGTAIFLGLISAPWLVQALHMVNYHVIGGVLITVILAQLVIPAWLGEATTRSGAMVSGFCLAFLGADAYALAPSALLFAASAGLALWRRPDLSLLRHAAANVAIGFGLGFVIILVWMLRFADIIGYFVFHIITNQVNYARYIPFGWGWGLRTFIPSARPEALVQSSASIEFLSGLLLLTGLGLAPLRARPVSRVLSLAAFVLAVFILNMRGAFGFQDGTFVVTSVAVLALALPNAIAPAVHGGVSFSRAWIATAMIGLLLTGAELVDRAALISPFAISRKQFLSLPKTHLAVDYRTPIFRRIRSILKPDERLLVLVYNPDFFLPAGFLPIRKFHEYLPWEADYARHPWFGRNRDLCAEVSARPPPVIYYDAWIVWGIHNPATYMACIPSILKAQYVPDAIRPLYVRRDRMSEIGKAN